MRKKSHVSLAGYMVRELELENLTRHKKAFYFGSVLPDLNPMMFIEPHQFEKTYEWLQSYVRQMTADQASGACAPRVLWRRMGMALHYLADYFTYPHNVSYDGGVSGHCLYERELKYALRRFVRTREAIRIFDDQRRLARNITGLSQLFAYIEQQHEIYLSQEPTVDNDCRWIVTICALAVLVLARQNSLLYSGLPGILALT